MASTQPVLTNITDPYSTFVDGRLYQLAKMVRTVAPDDYQNIARKYISKKGRTKAKQSGDWHNMSLALPDAWSKYDDMFLLGRAFQFVLYANKRITATSLFADSIDSLFIDGMNLKQKDLLRRHKTLTDGDDDPYYSSGIDTCTIYCILCRRSDGFGMYTFLDYTHSDDQCNENRMHLW